MPSRAQTVTVTYYAWDVVSNVPKTGDVANHTLRWVKDGTSAAPTNSASEVDATNAPGLYKITLTTSECTCNVGTLHGKSSTAGVYIFPRTISFEQLPTAAPDASSGLYTIGGTNALPTAATIASATVTAMDLPTNFGDLAISAGTGLVTTSNPSVEGGGSSGVASMVVNSDPEIKVR